MERPRDRLERVVRVHQLVRGGETGPARGGEQEPVVGPDVQPVVAVAERERAPRAAHSRIHDGQVDADGHVLDRVREHERALEHRRRRDPVRDVDDLGVRRDALHDAVARPDEVVLEPEVAQERDEHARSVTPRSPERLRAARPRGRAAPRTVAGDLAAQAQPRGRMRTKAVGAWTGNGRPTSTVASSTPPFPAARRAA